MTIGTASDNAFSAGEIQDLDSVRAIVLGALSGYAARVFLFGSRSAGAHRRMSDIDVAVLHDGSIPASEFARVRGLLEDSAIVRAVDLIDLTQVNASFRQRVLAQGEEWSG
jgi:predicted nucleotidyltransferase